LAPSSRNIPFFLGNLSLFAGVGGCGEGEPLVAGVAVADSGESQGADDEGGFFLGVLGGVVSGTASVVLCAAPVAASGFQRGAGGGIPAGFGGVVTAEAEQVRPAA
jgi:hypothetical protein